jgi:transformation/transcription domain-associated protein
MAIRPDVWPNSDLKLASFEKILAGPQGVDSNQPNYVNICTCLELLGFLLTVLRKEQILTAFRPLQKSIATCMTSPNSKVIRTVHNLLSRLMAQFPTESTNSSVASKHEELDQLYAAVGKVIYEGLNNYDKNPQAAPSALFGTLMMLKAACTNNGAYIDRLISNFMGVLQRMAREHLGPSAGDSPTATSELLVLSLELVKNRVGVMSLDMRKTFIGNILVSLIEKSPDVKVLKAIVKIVEDWMKVKDLKIQNQGPNLKEKSILLVKMMQHIEKRFPDDADLNGHFLDLVNFVYRDEQLRNTELTSKLEQAFLAGLRCLQPHIRQKFFEVFDGSMRKRLHERILYIVCSQNWEAMGPHYWIKQCIELLLCTASTSTAIQNCTPSSFLPSVTSVIGLGDASERNAFNVLAAVKEEPPDAPSPSADAEMAAAASSVGVDDVEDADVSMSMATNGTLKKEPSSASGAENAPGGNSLAQLVARQHKFLESVHEVKTSQFLGALAQLAHMDHSLAENVWLSFFPRAWRVLNDRQREALASEIVPFVCSGVHVLQKDCQPISALNTFVEALALCRPAIPIRPAILKYLGKSHNLWHRATLLLERLAFEGGGNHPQLQRPRRDTDPEHQLFPPHLELGPNVSLNQEQEALDALSEMYSLLREEDMWAGLWQKKAKYPETSIAIAYEQQGFFEQAQGAYELAMTKFRNDNSCPTHIQQEVKLWEEHWLRSSKELNQWEILLEYGNGGPVTPQQHQLGRGAQGAITATNPLLVLESAWRSQQGAANSSNWPLAKDALQQVEQAFPREMAWKINLYKGFLAICHPEDQHLPAVERHVEQASALCMKEWRRLPKIVSHVHLPFLQAAQQVMELQGSIRVAYSWVYSRSCLCLVLSVMFPATIFIYPLLFFHHRGRTNSSRIAARSTQLVARHEGHRQNLAKPPAGGGRRSFALVRYLHLAAASLQLHRQSLQCGGPAARSGQQP